MMHALRLFCFATALVLPCAGAPAAFSFLRIAHTSQAIPGGTGNFTGFDPEVTNGNFSRTIIFRGFGAGGQEGIYASSGAQIFRLVDRSTRVPGTEQTFDAFGSPSASDTIVLQASGAGRSGIYRIFNSPASIGVVDDAPIGAATFGRAAASGTNVVAYRRDDVIMSNRTGTLAAENFSVPNVVIESLGDPDVASHNAFGNVRLAVRVNYLQGGVPHTGVFAKGVGPGDDEVLFPTTVAETEQVSVGFSGAVAANQGDGGVRFRSSPISDQQVLIGDLIPGGTGGFTGFRGVSAGLPTLGLFSTNVVFVGLGASGQEGIYVHGLVGATPGGFPLLTKVIARGDVLDGRVVDRVDLGRDGAFGVNLAVHARFTDGSSGIYFTVLPEPAALVVLPMIPILLAGRRRHSVPPPRPFLGR